MEAFIFICAVLSAVCGSGIAFDTTGQDWGYVDVRPGGHMFWWLYETTAKVAKITDRPLLIWLQGGPGASSTGYGNFEELGPLDINLKRRNSTWVNDYNILFIDNPVGTGFSYVDKTEGFTTTNTEIAIDLVACINGFYLKRPEFENVTLYITSESYGGKMAIEFALELLSEHKLQGKKTNLKGVQLIDSWISPMETISSWAEYLYNFGAIDKEGFKIVDEYAKRTETLVAGEKWEAATDGFISTEYAIMSASKNVDFYNVLKPIKSNGYKNSRRIVKPGASEIDGDDLLFSLMNGPIRTALGLDAIWGEQSSEVFSRQAGDFMKPVTRLVERVLDETDLTVQVVTGQLDLIVATPGTIKWVDNLQWAKSSQWSGVARNALVADGYREGYVKKLGKLALYWVNRSGHMVPADNIHAMRVILKDLTGI